MSAYKKAGILLSRRLIQADQKHCSCLLLR